MLVSKRVGVDLPAGPTELLVLADAGADPATIALDLVSQAEHSEDCTCGLVTDSEALASDVLESLKSLLQSAPRREIASRALVEKGFVLVCRSLDEGVRFVGAFAPEHVEIMTSGATDLAGNIDSAGLILIGEDSPVAATDYAVGSNHILPTGGYARLYSGLSSLDFVKVVNVVECSKNSLRRVAGTVRTLSSLEGLPNHWLAVQRRLAR
jgi:histidinol dehydrogenase